MEPVHGGQNSFHFIRLWVTKKWFLIFSLINEIKAGIFRFSKLDKNVADSVDSYGVEIAGSRQVTEVIGGKRIGKASEIIRKMDKNMD